MAGYRIATDSVRIVGACTKFLVTFIKDGGEEGNEHSYYVVGNSLADIYTALDAAATAFNAMPAAIEAPVLVTGSDLPVGQEVANL